MYMSYLDVVYAAAAAADRTFCTSLNIHKIIIIVGILNLSKLSKLLVTPGRLL